MCTFSLRHFTVLILCLILASCLGCIDENQIVFKKIENIRLERRDNERFLAADLVIENKSGFSCTIENTLAEILIDGQTMCKATLLGPMRLEAKSTQHWPCRLNFRPENVLMALPSGMDLLVGDKRLKTSVRGEIGYRKFIFRRQKSFEVVQELDLKSFKNLF